MPRKITTINELTENAAVMGRDYCPMCGAIHGSQSGEIDRPEHPDSEIVRQLALFMDDDWKACSVLLLYAANPSAPISLIDQKIRISPAAICTARQRAAKRFPSLAGILGLNSRQARGQQNRFKKSAAMA